MPLHIPAALRREVHLPAVLRREVRLPAVLRRDVRLPMAIARPVGRVVARGLGAAAVVLAMTAARNLRGGSGSDVEEAPAAPPSGALASNVAPVSGAAADVEPGPADAPADTSAGDTPSDQSAEGGARFVARYDDATSPGLAEVAERASREDVLEHVARTLNARYVLPAPVAVVGAECGTANAFYRPTDRTITLCYELLRDAEAFGARIPTADGGPTTVAAGVAHFVLLHEAGHALIDVLHLPITGREEDAVDQFATVLLLQDADGAVDAVWGAAFFRDLGRRQGTGEALFADEHGLGAQRFYNVACWMYGSDRQAYAGFVARGPLPPERAARCPDEFRKLDAG